MSKTHPNTLDVGGDEAGEGTNVGVDAGEVGTRAALSPADDADDVAGGIVADRAAGVTLAGVDSALGNASAEHDVGDLAAVGVVAAVTADDGDGDLLEGGGEGGAALLESTPASDGEAVAVGGVEAGRGEAGVAEGAAVLSDVLGQLPDGDVVVEGGGAEVGVDDDLGDASGDTTGGAVLPNALVTFRGSSCQRETYQGAGTDGDGAGGGAGRAVGGGENGVGVQEGATAEVGAALLERDDVGEVADRSVLATDDELVDISGGSREGRGQGDGRGESDGAGEGSHCECWKLRFGRLDLRVEDEDEDEDDFPWP